MRHSLRGDLPPGPTNSLTDVPGVRVGHRTLIRGDGIRTGVTAIVPHPGNLYEEKVEAAALVINGYGKAVGFHQINELGSIETPILVTNTLSVGIATDPLVSWALSHYQNDRTPILSINPVVPECNDGFLNDIRGRHVDVADVHAALDGASQGKVAEGALGAGTGMSAFGYKSGIGSASRMLHLKHETFTLGVLSLPNFGTPRELTLAGAPIGRALAAGRAVREEQKAGSIIIVIGTDLPCSHRQLLRIARRAVHGIARTGGTTRSGSGEFVVAFTTAHRIPSDPGCALLAPRRLNDATGTIDLAFAATVDAVEESIHNALFAAETTYGAEGHVREALPIEETLAILRETGRIQA